MRLALCCAPVFGLVASIGAKQAVGFCLGAFAPSASPKAGSAKSLNLAGMGKSVGKQAVDRAKGGFNRCSLAKACGDFEIFGAVHFRSPSRLGMTGMLHGLHDCASVIFDLHDLFCGRMLAFEMKSPRTSLKAVGRLVRFFAGQTSRCQQFNLLRLINQAKILTTKLKLVVCRNETAAAQSRFQGLLPWYVNKAGPIPKEPRGVHRRL